MITYVAGSLFTSPAQVLVNTVNIEGVMGKGIALQFKRAFPAMFSEYQLLCEKGQIDIGVLWIYRTPHKWVLNFPTKKSWRHPSQIEYVEKGLQKFVEEFNELKIHSIAFPALGCGNGELDWDSDVKPLMDEYLKGVPADVFIYPPLSTSEIPEHKNPVEIIKWLRSEPQTLSFTEVWSDLKAVLASTSTFSTGAKEFTAEILEDSEGKFLVVTTETRKHRIEYEELREVWSRFRSHGFLRRSVVSNVIVKVLYYLIPIFAELDYVDRIELSETGSFRGRTYAGLQYRAPIENVHQLELF